MGKWYTLQGPKDNFSGSCSRGAEQSERWPLTSEVWWEQSWKEQGHGEGELRWTVLVICAPSRMGRMPKSTGRGEIVGEESRDHKSRFSSLRNLVLLPAKGVKETCNLVSSGGSRQALMVNVKHALSYGKRLPSDLTVKKCRQLFFTINVGNRLCQVMAQSATWSVRIWNYKTSKIIPFCRLLETQFFRTTLCMGVTQ